MKDINSQANMLKTAYVYVAVFILASLLGVFFAYSGTIDNAKDLRDFGDIGEGVLVQGLEPTGENFFSSIFFDSFKFDFLLRAFLLSGIVIFILNVCGIRKFIPALIITGLVAAHPFLIALFKIQAAFSIIPAIFFGLLAIVLTLNIHSRLKFLSYLALLISALFMPVVAIAFAFITLLYQLLPVDMAAQTPKKRESKRIVLASFAIFFALLILEQVFLGDFINFKFFGGLNAMMPAMHLGEGAAFFIFPFGNRLSTFAGSSTGAVALGVICVLTLFFIVLSMRSFFRKNAKLENISQKLSVLYWSIGLLIFLVLSGISHELSERMNSTAFFAGIAVLICVFTYISKLKFKIGMFFGLAASAFAIVLLLTSLLTQATWSSTERVMLSLKNNKEYQGFASAHLAKIAFKKAVETNNPQRFEEYHKEFKAQFADYNSYKKSTSDDAEIVNSMKFADLDLALKIHEIIWLWDAEVRRASLNLPHEKDEQTFALKKLKLAELFAKHKELTASLEQESYKSIKSAGKYSFIFESILPILPNEEKTAGFAYISSGFSFEPDKPAKLLFHPNLLTSELRKIIKYNSFGSNENLYDAVFARFLASCIREDFMGFDDELDQYIKYLTKMDAEQNNGVEITKLLTLADLLLVESEKYHKQIAKTIDANKISLQLLGLIVSDISPYQRSEILLRRGLLFHFVQNQPEDASRIYDKIIALSNSSDYKNPQLISHVLYLKSLFPQQKNQWTEALDLLKRAIELDKDNYSAQIMRSRIRTSYARFKLDDIINKFTKEYRALPEDKQHSVVERAKFIPIWELERAFFEENKVYRESIQDIENNFTAAYKIDSDNQQLQQTYADLLYYRGYGQRALKNTDLAELSLRKSYNILPENKTEIIGAKITDVLGQFYFEVWSAYLQSESITEENQAEVNNLLARALQLSKFVRDELYEFVLEYIDEFPDLDVMKLLPFYLTAKEIYPDWAPARRWLADYFKKLGTQQLWEKEYAALLECTQDEDEWPTLNFECSQTYLLWASYGLRKLQEMRNSDEIREQMREIQRLFEKSDEHNEVFVRFGDSKFLYWQNRSILYQRWADLLVSTNDEASWLMKIDVAIESFENYLTQETIEANNAALTSLYRSKFLYLWRKNHAKWYGDYIDWEQNVDVSVMLDCIMKYRDWSLKPYDNTIAANTEKLVEKKEKLEKLKKIGADKEISKLGTEIAELMNDNDEINKQLTKIQTVNRWLFNYIEVLQGIAAYRDEKFDTSAKFFNNSYNTVKSSFDAFWLGRLNVKQGNADSAIRWFLISAEKYPQAFYEIAQILDEKDKEVGLDTLYLKTYMELTESFKDLAQVKDLRAKVAKILANKGNIKNTEQIKLHLAKLDEISVEIELEDSDSSAISLIMAQLNDLLSNYIVAFEHYVKASNAESMFHIGVFNAGEVLSKTDDFIHLSQIVLRMLKNSLIYTDKNAVLTELSEKTDAFLSEIEAKLKGKTFESAEIAATKKVIEQASAELKNSVYDFILSELYRAERDFTNAKKYYKSACSSKLLIFPAYLAIADMLNGLEGQKPKAFAAYKEYIKLLQSAGISTEKIPEKSRANYNAILDYFNDKLKTGKNAYEAGDFKTAIKNLEECYKFRTDARTAYIIAGAYREIIDIPNAEDWYLKTIHSSEIILHAYFDLAEMLENVPEKRWRAYWALSSLLEMLKGSIEMDVKLLESKARTLLGTLDSIRQKYYAEGLEFFNKNEFKKAYEAFMLSYKTNESPETAYFIGKCLMSIWEHKENAESTNRKDLEELEDAENWFIIAAESDKSIATGYYDLGAAYRKTVKRDTKTKEYYTLFLKKTKDSQDADTKIKRENAQTYLDVAESMIKSSFEDGKKYYYAKNYDYAYEKFLLNFRHSNSTDTALWIGRALENLKRFDDAQDWYLIAAEDLPEAFYELAKMWYQIPIQHVRWVAIKYFSTFIMLSENIDKLKDLREKSIKMKKSLESELADFLSKPVEIPISQLRSNTGVYENLYETAEMFFKNPERKWAADKYFSAFIQLTQGFGKYQEKYVKAKEIQKTLEKEYTEALTKAFDFMKKDASDKAIAEFIIVLNIKRTFPADYSMLLTLLEQQKRHKDLILWSDRAVSFYGDSTAGFKYRLYEQYFYVNAFAHYQFGVKDTGIEKLKAYLDKWKDGKYVENVKKMLKNALQTKPD